MRALGVGLVLLSSLACDDGRRVSGGATTPGTTTRTDAGRPIDAGPRPTDPPTDGGTPTSGLADYCAEQARLLCQANLRCCTEPGRRYASEAECMAERAIADCLGRAAFADGRARFDSRLAASLLADLTALTEACRADDGSRYEVPVVGTVPEGGDCTSTNGDVSTRFSCVPGTYCWGEAPSSCRAYAPIGGTCREGRCPDFSWCSSETFTCQPGGSLGDTCGGEFNGRVCADGYCVSGSCQSEARSESYCAGE